MREGDCAGALPAASLLLVERSGRRVLMGRRPEASRFMPGVYVFPGGAVESADRSVPACRRLPDRHARLVVA